MYTDVFVFFCVSHGKFHFTLDFLNISMTSIFLILPWQPIVFEFGTLFLHMFQEPLSCFFVENSIFSYFAMVNLCNAKIIANFFMPWTFAMAITSKLLCKWGTNVHMFIFRLYFTTTGINV
jgi:hypothetical protein